MSTNVGIVGEGDLMAVAVAVMKIGLIIEIEGKVSYYYYNNYM